MLAAIIVSIVNLLLSLLIKPDERRWALRRALKRRALKADSLSMAQAQRLQALLDLSRALSSSLDLREVLREFATHAAQLTGATAAELSTYDPARGELVMLVEYREGRDEITATGGQVYHLADFPATRHVLDTQEPVQVRVENPDDDAAERALLERQGQKSLLMLPLVARGETIGLMEIVDVAGPGVGRGRRGASAGPSATSSPPRSETPFSSPSCRRPPRGTR